jgi:hypothetical protein
MGTDIEPTPFDAPHEDDSGRTFPWAPLEEETAMAFHAFAAYRDLPPSKRSIAAVARQIGKDPGHLRLLSAKHSWVDRAKAYDAWLDRQAVENLARGRTQMREAYVHAAEVAREKVMQRLRTLDPEEMSVRDLATWLELCNKVERQNRGEPDKVVEVKGQVSIADSLDADTRRSLMAEALAVLKDRLGIKDADELEAEILDAEVVDGGQE